MIGTPVDVHRNYPIEMDSELVDEVFLSFPDWDEDEDDDDDDFDWDWDDEDEDEEYYDL